MNLPPYPKYSPSRLRKIRATFNSIRELTKQRSAHYRSASYYQLRKDSLHFNGDASLCEKLIADCEADIQVLEIEIENHTKWLEEHASEVLDGIRTVSPHITTWSSDYSMVSLPAVRHENTGQADNPTRKELEAMQKWYCHFFGEAHLA